jgi:hypothetical protein
MRRAGVLLLALLSGCDPEVEIAGTVTTSDGGLAANTKVELNCTGGTQLAVPKFVQTDSAGRFKLKGKGCLPSSCTLSSGAGFRRAEQPLMEWCTRSAPSCPAGSCIGAQVNLVLP